MQSHDKVFKLFLSDITVARDFFAIHLPPDIGAHCDFTTLRRESASFVDEALRARVADMLYSLNTRAGAGYTLNNSSCRKAATQRIPWSLHR